ncbi:hypothetical protein CYMTET_55131 [Cymbomonas tetramitiformis]|uniref:Uncharacterized protein n=2 Tax=Cymbomonas tetramitiformis TaxID=36881 RepID=A0AAE0EPZ9_9CHLO|nr:hypothetical protein CYMTET_55131 [Cymbomonas tetramitiformis]
MSSSGEADFFVVVKEDGTVEKLVDVYHRPVKYQVVMDVSPSGNTSSQYYEKNVFGRHLGGFFVKQVINVKNEERYVVECFDQKKVCGDSVLHIVSVNKDPQYDTILQYLIGLVAMVFFHTRTYRKLFCALCVLPREHFTQQMWPAFSSFIGTRFCDGYTIVRIPTELYIQKDLVINSEFDLLRDEVTHRRRGVCTNAVLIDALRTYAFDETDHGGFLEMGVDNESYDDVTVENGFARMIHRDDRCAIYKDKLTEEQFLVVYMRLPDYLEDQLFHLLADNTLMRDWKQWSESVEMSNANRYSLARRRAVTAFCFCKLLQYANYDSITEADKLSWNAYNSKAVNGLLVCEMRAENDATPMNDFPKTMFFSEAEGLNRVSQPRTASSVPRVVDDAESFVHLMEMSQTPSSAKRPEGKLDLIRMYSENALYTNYNPELFPGLRMSLHEQNARASLFFQGNVIVTGCNTFNIVERMWDLVEQRSKPYLSEVNTIIETDAVAADDSNGEKIAYACDTSAEFTSEHLTHNYTAMNRQIERLYYRDEDRTKDAITSNDDHEVSTSTLA